MSLDQHTMVYSFLMALIQCIKSFINFNVKPATNRLQRLWQSDGNTHLKP